MSHSILQNTREFMDRLGYAQGGLVVAVSGGPDSIALLRALVMLRTGPFLVAHLNHQLRGADSDADEEFVQETCAALQTTGAAELDFRHERMDVAARARAEGANLEDTARRIRYDWLTRVALEAGARWVA